MNTEMINETEIKKTFDLKKHHTIQEVKVVSADKAQAQIETYVKQLEAEGYEVNVRMVGNQVLIDKRKKENDTIIDGHFWVEYRGKNIDLTTDRLVEIIKPKKERLVYLPVALEEGLEFYNQQLEEMKAKHIAKGYDWNEVIADAMTIYGLGKFSSFDCFKGVMVLKELYGDEAVVRYGQLGVLRPNGMIYWYFGHPDEPKELWIKEENSNEYIKTETPASKYPNLIYDPRTPPIIKKQKPNEVCNCGSTKKFKKCCGKNI